MFSWHYFLKGDKAWSNQLNLALTIVVVISFNSIKFCNLTFCMQINIKSYFLLKKRKLANFRFCSIFIFNKKEPQSCQCATYRRNALFEFLRSQTGQMALPIFKVNSLAKTVHYFENTLKPSTEIIFLS